MKKIYKYLLGILLIFISYLFFTASFDRKYIDIPFLEGEVDAIKLESGKVYRQSLTTTRYSISQISLPLRLATTASNIDSTIELTVFREGEAPVVRQIQSSFINNEGSVAVGFDPPLITEPGQQISFSLIVPPVLSGRYRIQLAPEIEDAQVGDLAFRIDQQAQERDLGFTVYYIFRPPLAYQLGIFLLFGALLLIANLPVNSKPSFVLYTVALSVAFVSPGVWLGYFSLMLLGTFVLGFVSMFLWLRVLKLPLFAILLGAHAFAFTTYFPLHIFSGREKLITFALLPLIFLMFYPTSRFVKKHFKTSLLVLLTLILFVVFLPYRPAPVKPVHVVALKDIFLDPNQIPLPGKVNEAYYTWLLPKGDPAVIEYYGGWSNFGSYLGYINLLLGIVGIIVAARRHWVLLAVGAFALIISSSSFLTPTLSSFMPMPPQYFIIIATFTLATFAGIGLNILWRFLGKDPLTSIIIATIVFIALFDLLNVSSKTLQFGLL